MRISAAPRHDKCGFSLVELLVVVGIIVLVVALLLPVISHVRKASRSTKCLANLQQWGHLYQIYASGNRVRSLPEMGTGNNAVVWWESLAPNAADARAILLCPEALEPRSDLPQLDNNLPSANRGSATFAWTSKTGRGLYDGSYGLNMWTFDRANGVKLPFIQFPAKDVTTIPLIGDCIDPWEAPLNGSRVPSDLTQGGAGIGGYCIDRHGLAVNLVFLDGHAERVMLANLWKLRWAQNSVPTNVTVP